MTSNEDIKQLFEREGELKRQSIEREEELAKIRADILNKILLKLTGLEESIKNLKKEKGAVSDFKSVEEEGEIGDISADKSTEITTILDFIKRLSEDEKGKDEINMMRDMGLIDVSADRLMRVRQILSIVSLLPKEDQNVADYDKAVEIFLADLKKSVEEMEIQLLYNVGVTLLKTGAFVGAYECFDKVTKTKPELKGAWLNRGVALGELGDRGLSVGELDVFEEEMKCYDKAKDIECEKDVRHNIEITQRRKRWRDLKKQAMFWRN